MTLLLLWVFKYTKIKINGVHISKSRKYPGVSKAGLFFINWGSRYVIKKSSSKEFTLAITYNLVYH